VSPNRSLSGSIGAAESRSATVLCHRRDSDAYFFASFFDIDAIDDPARPAHTCLLGAGIPVCEHLTNLAAVPRQGAFLHAVPIPWVGGATFPVRAYVLTDMPETPASASATQGGRR
jgi:hypothetical protein